MWVKGLGSAIALAVGEERRDTVPAEALARSARRCKFRQTTNGQDTSITLTAQYHRRLSTNIRIPLRFRAFACLTLVSSIISCSLAAQRSRNSGSRHHVAAPSWPAMVITPATTLQARMFTPIQNTTVRSSSRPRADEV